MSPESLSLLTAIVGLAVASIATLLTARSSSIVISSRNKGYSPLSFDSHSLYEDEDGSATQGSQDAYRVRLPKTLTGICALVAVLVSVASVVWGTVKPDESPLLPSWLFFAGWCLILVQTLALIREPLPTQRFSIGMWISFTSIVLVLCTGLELYSHLESQKEDGLTSFSPSGCIALGQIIVGILTAIASTLLPRRPEVYQGGSIVDAQYTTTALGRYTFTWARPILDKAKFSRLEYSDLPTLDKNSRSEAVQSRLHEYKGPNILHKLPLWRQVYRDHQHSFLLQWALTAVESLVMIVPQICLFKMLEILQKRGTSQYRVTEVWLYAAGLGLSKVIHVSLESWVEWLSFALLAVPIRAQLSALVFQKSMNMKDVKVIKGAGKGAIPKKSSGETLPNQGKVTETASSFIDTGAENRAPTAISKQDENDSPEDKVAIEARQGAINLIGVDAQRISDFCGYNAEIPGTLLKVAIAVVFLVQLIGWWAVLAGLAVPMAFQPLNSVAAKHYAKQQSAVMVARDAKTHIVTEALQGIRQIKFSAIEAQWQSSILAARKHELDKQWRVYIWAIYLTFCWYSMPILLGAASLAVYAWLNGGMTPAVAFTSLAVFTKLEYSLSVMPNTISELLDARVSIKRIQQHLEGPEKQPSTVAGEYVAFEHVEVAWPSDEEGQESFRLRDVTLTFPEGELSVIHGKTGSGKSLLLAALLGEADIRSGRIVVPKPESNRHDGKANRENWILPSSMAFVAQIPWLEDASIKDNVLFGNPLDHERYKEVLYACALVKDMEMLPDGDLTEIGASGINLSGGQRWRVAVARALYSRAGILVLDDIFSAVDAHVGRHILDHGITGRLAQGRTRILVTHHIELVLPEARYVVHLGDNGYVQSTETKKPTRHKGSTPDASLSSSTALSELEDRVVENCQPKPAVKKFVEEEKREKGQISTKIFKDYMDSSGGISYWSLTLVVFILVPVAILGRSWWIKLWTQDTERRFEHPVTGPPDQHLGYYLGIYLAISLIASAVVCIKIYMVCAGALRASKTLFEEITFKVLRAPLRWLDTVPLGRVLNRFVSDFALIDSRFSGDLQYFITGVLNVAGITVAGLFVTPWVILPFAVLGALCFLYICTYLQGARDIKRLEASARSPIFELYGSALMGLATIRSFDMADDYLQRMFTRIDRHSNSTFHLWLTTRWMAFRMGIVGSLFALCVAAFVAGAKGIDASLAGFALSFALDYSNTIIETIRRYAGVELDMNSTERIVEYTSMTIEEQTGADVPSHWPSEGRITITDLEAGYAPDLPSILKGLTFTVEPRQRIGVVGRTGSGKTSLTLSLFRFLEARKGQINIDGIDISKIKLHELRSRLAIIPQDPVLFSGTLRSNLDPFDERSDTDLHDALKRVYLLEQDQTPKSNHSYSYNSMENTQNANVFEDLQTPISQGGLNLSQGQRQLLCLARAIVTHPKIIVLDEATSAVDMATDRLIQRSIREQFTSSTLIVIAHRLSTIVDFDRVLVMGDGVAVEYGEPKALMRTRGAFWEMLNESGEKAKLEAMLFE